MKTNFFYGMRLVLLCMLTNLAFNCRAQLTIGQVYDFDIGDLFQSVGMVNGSAGTPPTIINKTILGKALSGNSVTYTIQVGYYTPPACQSCPASASSTVVIETYTNLSSPLIPANETSTCVGTEDTTYYSQCNRLTMERHPDFANSCFEPTLHTTRYVQGAGGPYYDKTVFSSPTPNNSTSLYLQFYVKQSNSCGTTFINSPEPELKRTSVYPNPAGDYVIVETDTPMSYYTLFDITGKLCRAGKMENKYIETAGLSRGTYFINLYSPENSIKTVKIIKD
jgi:hypothetical protein